MTETRNVHQRLAAAMGEVDYIQKEKKQGMNYTIVSHDAVTAKVRPVLLKHGIVYYPVRCEASHEGNRAACQMTVRFVNIDNPADFFDVPTFGYGIDPQDKGPGKAMSYAVKYALLKALGLETGDDPDHDDLPYEPPAKATKTAPAPKPETPPPFNPGAAAARIMAGIAKCKTLQELRDRKAADLDTLADIKFADKASYDLVVAAFNTAHGKLNVPLPPALEEAMGDVPGAFHG